MPSLHQAFEGVGFGHGGVVEFLYNPFGLVLVDLDICSKHKFVALVFF